MMQLQPRARGAGIELMRVECLRCNGGGPAECDESAETS